MKKLFSLFLVLALLCCSAFAMTVDEAITALKNPDSALSGEFDATVKITLDEPLPEFLGEDMATISTGLNDSSIGMHMVYSVSEDYKTMQAQMDMEITSPLFGDLLPEGIKTTSWMDLDFSDESAPKYNVIAQIPGTDFYQQSDLADPAYGDTISMLTTLLDKDALAEYTDSMVSAIYEDRLEKGESDNEFILTLSQEDLITIAEELAPIYEGMYSSLFSSIDLTGIDTADMEAAIAQVKDFFANTQIFAEDALVMTITFDENGLPASESVVLNVDANLYEIATALGETIPDATEENSTIKGSFSIDCTYSKVNEDITVTMPTLTEENTYDPMTQIILANEIFTTDELAKDEISVYVPGEKVEFDVPPMEMDGRTLVPVRKFCNAIGISDDNIGYEDGVVTIEFEGKTITLTIDDDTAYIDDTPVTLDVPAKEIDGRTLLPLRFIGETFNMDVDYDSLTVIGGTGMVVTLNPPAEETSSQTPETELPATDTTESDRVSVAVPEDIDDATKEALTALENENFTIVYIPDNSYPEKANLMIAAGEPAIFIDTHHSLSEAITTHEGAFLAFETLSDAANQLIEGDEDLAAAITGEDEKIYAYPIANGENIIYVYMSSTLNDPESALEFIQSLEAALAE